MDHVETVVVGAGVVGLAIAQALAASGREVLIVEAEPHFGRGISARNSEVIHAGLYYDPGSLKARMCVEGRGRLYAWCAERGVAHRRCGKLIVATQSGQQKDLERIQRRAQEAGVTDLSPISAQGVRELEPALNCKAALYSPSTGIVDGQGLMLSILGSAQDHGAQLACMSRVETVLPQPTGFRIEVESQGIRTWVACDELINSAGLGAVALAHRIDGLPAQSIPQAWLAKGSYFGLGLTSPFSRLIYPVPNEAGLGIHLTLDLAGQARFGPDVEWVDAEDYRVDATRLPLFEAEIRRYWADLPQGVLQPAYAGIRPKISGPGELAADFQLSGPAEHGFAGLVNAFGIESPGLTSSLAIGARVREILDDCAA